MVGYLSLISLDLLVESLYLIEVLELILFEMVWKPLLIHQEAVFLFFLSDWRKDSVLSFKHFLERL